MYQLLDLFSGVGGFSLGLERSGYFNTVAFCEYDEYPSRVLNKHWPEVPNYGDIRELTAEKLHEAGIFPDAICGGFPCQNISTAAAATGNQTGIEGEKSGLWKEYARLIGELTPRVVIIENVSALLRQGLASLLQDLSALGYDAEWHCIPAAAVGSVQNRDRIWIVAYPSSLRAPGLLTAERVGKMRQRRTCSPENLLEVYDRHFGRSVWPQPLVRRGDGRVPHWVDRVKACGNSLDPRLAETIGRYVGENFIDGGA